MLSRHPLSSALALILYLGSGVVAPLLDASLLHEPGDRYQIHLESADNNNCHNSQCSLASRPRPVVETTSPIRAPAATPPLEHRDIAETAVRLAASSFDRNNPTRAPPQLA